MRVPSLFSTTAGLAVGATLVVAATVATGAYFYSTYYSNGLLQNARESALTQGELVKAALEHQMLEDDRSLIDQMINTFGRQPRVEQVVLLDREGQAQFSSVPLGPKNDFQPGSATCQACHQFPPDQRMNSRVIETQGGAVLRTVLPIENKPECYQCHDAEDKITGVLMVDLNVNSIRAGMDRDLRWMVAGTGGLTLVLMAGIGGVVRVGVLRRLGRFETTARMIASGDLDQRVPTEGADTISWLAREFNTMADTMTGLLDQVHGQQRRLETVINSIDDGIVVLDPKRHVIAANDAFLARTGKVREHVTGCNCRDVSSGVCTFNDCPTLACLESRERQVRVCERQTPNGVRWEEVHASPVIDATGRLVHIVEVWRDISDRRAAEARLSESHRLASLGLLATGFSHELNTPLATVLTCVEGILRETSGGPQAADATAHISKRAAVAREQILRCRTVTQHFLRMSRGQTSTPDIVDLGATLEAVERLIAPTAESHGVNVAVNPPAGLHVRADEAELQHVLINLVLNAIQASPKGAIVTLDVVAGDPVRIRVTDRGCGIAEEHRRRIFEPFFGLREGGTGLGLFLSLNFVRRWAGDITVASVPGAGSVFEVILPAAGIVAERRSA